MIIADLILPAVQATSKKQAFRAIAEATAELYHGDPDELLNALLDRERIGTTGIGSGVAIPHVKIAKVTKLLGVLARLETPIDYDAVDDKPVDIIFMLLAPSDAKTTQHLKMLAQISRFLKDANTCSNIRSNNCRDKLTDLIDAWAKSQAA